MVGVVGVGRGDAGEHVLVGLAGQQIAVLQGGLAEVGQKLVAGPVDLDFADEFQLRPQARAWLREPRLAGRGFLLRFTAHHDHKPKISPPL